MSLTHLGRYEITGTLGRGAMGIVYQALDPLIERTVAIKTIGCAGLTREETDLFEQRFFREARSAGRLNHPNIVTIHDIGRSDDLAFIAMEFLRGRSLRDILDSGVVLPLGRIAGIVAEIADGLAFAHANEVVHRDIKPANIMVLDNGTVKIADFGVALLPNGSATVAGMAFGSPKYMSPEQISGDRVDGRSDIFSLGAVLYEMLTGQPPFTGDNLSTVLYQVLHGTPPLPSSHNPDLPAGFDRIVARALAKDPDERYQNACEMATDLRNHGDAPASSMRHGQATANELATESRAVAAAHAGDETVQIKAVAPNATGESRNRSRALLFSAAIATLVITVGILFFYPGASRPPAEAGPPPAAPTTAPAALATSENEAQRAATPAPAEPPPQQADSRAALDAPAVAEEKPAERKAAAAKSGKPASATKPAKHASEQKAAASAPANWIAALRADLAACNRESFFPRISCVEKARWKHCPGHWGSVEECSYANDERRILP